MIRATTDDSQDPADPTAARDAADETDTPDDEAWLLEEMSDPHFADDSLLLEYLLGEMPLREMDRVAERLRVDPEFRERAPWPILFYLMPRKLKDPSPELLATIPRRYRYRLPNAKRLVRRLKARIQLRKLGLYPVTLCRREEMQEG
jgi:hypothetical protein